MDGGPETVGTIRRCGPSRIASGIPTGSTCARRAGPRWSSPRCSRVVVVTGNDAVGALRRVRFLRRARVLRLRGSAAPTVPRLRPLAVVGAAARSPSGPRSPTPSGRPRSVTLVVAFAIASRGALGGYFAAGGTAATLAFVLAVMSPGVEADLVARELGWVVGVVLRSGVAAVVAVAGAPARPGAGHGRCAGAARGGGRAGRRPRPTRDLGALRDADADLGASCRRRLPAGRQHHPRAGAGRARDRGPDACADVARRDDGCRARRPPPTRRPSTWRSRTRVVIVALDSSAQILDAAPSDGELDVDALHRRRATRISMRSSAGRRAHPPDRRRHARRSTRFTAMFPAPSPLARRAPDRDRRRRRRATTRCASRSAGQRRVADAWAILRAHCNAAVGAVPQRGARRAGPRRSRCSWRRPPRSSTPSGWCSQRSRCCVRRARHRARRRCRPSWAR